MASALGGNAEQIEGFGWVSDWGCKATFVADTDGCRGLEKQT